MRRTSGGEGKVTRVTLVQGGALVQLNNGQVGFVSVAELLNQVENGSAQVVREGSDGG